MGFNNTAIGRQALGSNTTGILNTATGVRALFNNTTGQFNTATGAQALDNNTTGQSNTATGNLALYNNTIGHYNTATGDRALRNNTSNYNTAAGSTALFATPPAPGIRLPVFRRSLTTPKVLRTQHVVLARSLTIPPVTATRPWASTPGLNFTTGNGNVCIGRGSEVLPLRATAPGSAMSIHSYRILARVLTITLQDH